jgi:hypothetical protein
MYRNWGLGFENKPSGNPACDRELHLHMCVQRQRSKNISQQAARCFSLKNSVVKKHYLHSLHQRPFLKKLR